MIPSEQRAEAETQADTPFMAGSTLAEFELLVPRGSAICTTCSGLTECLRVLHVFVCLAPAAPRVINHYFGVGCVYGRLVVRMSVVNCMFACFRSGAFNAFALSLCMISQFSLILKTMSATVCTPHQELLEATRIPSRARMSQATRRWQSCVYM